MITTRRGLLRAAALLPAVTLLKADEPKRKISPAVDRATAKAFRALYGAARRGRATSQHLRGAADMLELQFAHMDEVGLIAELEPRLAAAPAVLLPDQVEGLRRFVEHDGEELPDDLVARLLKPADEVVGLRAVIARDGMVKMNARVVSNLRALADRADNTRGGFLALAANRFSVLPVQYPYAYGGENQYFDDSGSGWGGNYCWYSSWILEYWAIVFAAAGIETLGITWGFIGAAMVVHLFC